MNTKSQPYQQAAVSRATGPMDVIVTSTCRDTIFPTVESFLQKVKFSGEFRFIVNVDVLNDKYLADVKNLFRDMNVKCLNLNYARQRHGKAFTKAVSFVMDRIESPLYFHLEDDWIFLKEIDLDPLVALFNDHPDINHICFSKKKILYYNELFYLRKLKVVPVGFDKLRTENVTLDGIPLVKTITYSTNPNISRSSHFQKLWFVNWLNIEQQFALQNFLLGNRRGYYIHGQIGDEPTVHHIG